MLNLRRIYEGFTCDQIHDIGILIVNMDLQIKYKTVITWKVSVYWVFLVRIFPHWNWIWRDTPYPSVFSLNTGKNGPEKLRIRTLFTQWVFSFLLSLILYHSTASSVIFFVITQNVCNLIVQNILQMSDIFYS